MRDLCTGCRCVLLECVYHTADELHDCMTSLSLHHFWVVKRLKRNKSPGIDGLLSEMPQDGGDILHLCLLVIYNLMPSSTNHFSKQLSVGLITTVYKSAGNKICDTSDC